MVATRHCCWGECNSDSRYPEKLHKSLRELIESGQRAFIPFAKPSHGIEKCKRWVNACSRHSFTIEKVTRNTFICALHWPGEKGPTEEHPDPLKANFTQRQKKKASAPKRKAPFARPEPPPKKKRICEQAENNGGEPDLDNVHEEPQKESFSYECVNTGKMVVDEGIQTEFTKNMLSAKIETMILRNEVTTMKNKQLATVISSLSYEAISENSKSMKHFVGLTPAQFEVLHDFLNSVCPLNDITYWNCKESTGLVKSNSGPDSRFSTREKLFICLVRLRRGFTVKTLAVLLSSPQKSIEETMIRKIITTYIQLMYKIFRDMETIMFPTKEQLRRYLPKVFKTMKNVRCSVDCTEFRIETSRNFARQGNTYSSYKHSNTFKCLIAVTPNGGACFVSDLFEGDIDDVQIFKDSGILKHIRPQDIMLVDRGFTVQDLLNPLQADIMIPAFLKGRKSLSAAEELSTRKIAKARIHVERFNERLKQFRLVGRKIPLSIAPIATQMVVVACGLVNFQTTLCK